MNNSKTISVFVFLMAGTLLTTTAVTIVPAAYAGGDDHDDDNGDGNKNKAEDESAAAIADCDDNEVEQAGFDCIAIAASEIETAEEPPEEEPEEFLLTVCKVVEDPNQEVVPSDFTFSVITQDLFFIQFPGNPPPDCTQFNPRHLGPLPVRYSITEFIPPGSGTPPPDSVRVEADEGDCTQDTTNPQRATGVLEIGEHAVCTFTNIYLDS